MIDLEIYRENHPLLVDSTVYKRWAKSNPGEAAKFADFSRHILAGELLYNPPGMATLFGKHIVRNAAMVDIEALPPPPPPPPPDPPPPPPPGGLIIEAPREPLTVKDGLGSQESGEFIYAPAAVSGGTRRGVHYRNYTGYGLGIMAWPAQPSAGRWLVEDMRFTNIGRNRTSNGTAEAGLWAGQSGDYRRFVADNCHWMGLWTGAYCRDSLFEHFECINMPLVGVYPEHNTRHTTFRNFRVRSRGTAFNVEWWYGGEGSHDLIIENFEIHSEESWGIFIDAGNYNVYVRNGKVTGAKGIAYPSKLADPNGKGGDVTIDWASIDMAGVTGTKRWKHDNGIG